MAEQIYARLLPHGKMSTYRSAKGTNFAKPKNPQDLVSNWEPVDDITLAELKAMRNGNGPSAPGMFEFLTESQLKDQVRTAKRQSGVCIDGLDLTDDDQKFAIQKMEQQLADQKRAAEEQAALSAMQQQQLTAQIAQLTALVQQSLGGGVGAGAAQQALPTIGAGASGDIADPRSAAPNVATMPNAEPAKSQTKRGGNKVKDEVAALGMPAAPQAAPTEVKPFVASSGTVTE